MLNVFFTADHELFFGQNTVSEEQVFIQPTYRLMQVLEQYNIPLCLMTDVCSICRYKELNINSNYVELMEEQLCQAVSRGHDVQLHIHPHWLTSLYIDGKWNFNYDNYRLHSFGFDENSDKSVQKIIADGKNYLLDLLTPIDPQYKCVAFRAGGWCIQPEKELLETLVAENIRIDTTLYYGGINRNPLKYYDFREIPNRAGWWINPKRGLKYEANRAPDNVFEIPIGSYNSFFFIGFKRLIYKIHRMLLKDRHEKNRGITIDAYNIKKMDLLKLKLQYFFFEPILFSYDSTCMKNLTDMLNYYLKHYNTDEQDFYVSVIGHPKTLKESSYEEIRKFCQKVSNEKSDKVRFIKLRDVII